jgi:tryptophan 2,3-dioxygenase
MVRKSVATVEPMSYSDYLHLHKLLTLQAPVSDDPDELLFVVCHQSIELWFKVIIADLRRVVKLIDEDRWIEAATVLGRANDCSALVLAQTQSLQRLPVVSFHAFRCQLGTASGAQSLQFRELEILSGLRHPGYLERLRAIGDEKVRGHLDALLTERSLAQAHQDMAVRHGVRDWTLPLRRPHAFGPLFVLNDKLLEFDDAWLRWRDEHVRLVQRMLGGDLRGTGGTDPEPFLGPTRRYRFFPYLWDVGWQVARQMQ